MTALDRLLAYSLPGYIDPGIPIAASRAGALGILDLEYAQDPAQALSAIHALARLGRGNRGIKVAAEDDGLVPGLLAELPSEIGYVVLCGSRSTDLSDMIAAVHDSERIVLVEALTLEDALDAAGAGADGVILKGNEAGGRVGDETAFVLLQRCLDRVPCPLWVQGGIGLHTAAACVAVGAAGVVLDWQLALSRESPLSDTLREHLASAAGADTVVVGDMRRDEMVRVHSLPRSEALTQLRQEEERLFVHAELGSSSRMEWRRAIAGLIGGSSVDALLLLGQDAAFGTRLAARYVTTAGILSAVAEAITDHIGVAREALPLDEHSSLAQAHGTRYPILQGPMTRVSDVAPFCAEVAAAGALPFLALALMRGPQVDELLRDTKEQLGDRPWGVGILGFVPAELREEQLEHVRRYRPPFAIIAGGRPDQADGLEREGITTYLHVPSPDLLDSFLKNGSRRFVFEGNECGGHTGPRSSFVLWESMIEILLNRIETGQLTGSDCQIVFAGGIHDARSSAMVAVLAAALARHEVKVGILMGTAYLFTREAVSSGAIVEGFQRQALDCNATAILELSPGHTIRCVESPFVSTFDRQKEAILTSGQSREEIEDAMEELVVGRLRIASKGVKRVSSENGRQYLEASPQEQHADGFYMIGQVAALRDSLTTAAELHEDVVRGGAQILASLGSTAEAADPEQHPCDIAIIGMAALMPGASNVDEFWRNILNRFDAVTEVPADRWNADRYYDPDRTTEKDRTYSRWGGFISPIAFDPVSFGMPPSSVASIDPIQLLSLEVARAALRDAGYGSRPFDRQRTSVIIGAGGNGGGDLGQQYGFRSMLSGVAGEDGDAIIEHLGDSIPKWTEDSFAGILPNVVAGRIANRFDLGGTNLTIDAACASSLASIYLAIAELQAGTSSMAIAGGADTTQNSFAYICFSKTHALSPAGRCRTFDEEADGIATSEGIGLVVLKRLEDAEHDGDRIYAVIKGIGASSDGRDKGLTAPRAEGQMRALERAYAQAGISPATVELLEAHGTGTVVGDRTEIAALTDFWSRYEPRVQSCAVGSVKSMIGHTKASAGAAGMIKTSLALHDKVLPPTIGVEKPNSRANFRETPFFVNSEVLPWIHSGDEPRRAGVSAFGFGGTNFHLVLEEYTGGIGREAAPAIDHWPSELFVWAAKDRKSLVESISSLEGAIADSSPSLADLAYSICAIAERSRDRSVRLALVATSVDDLREKLKTARSVLADTSKAESDNPAGVFFSERPGDGHQKIAFLFSGQGSQYPGMGRDLAIAFPEARSAFEQADRELLDRFDARQLSSLIFPPPAFTPEDRSQQRQALVDTHVAQPALGAMETAQYSLLRDLGVRPDMLAGHSYGEFAALWAAGAYSTQDLLRLSEARGRCMKAAAGAGDAGTMAAVAGDAETVEKIITDIPGVVCANLNAPRQTVISGTREAVATAIEALGAQDLQARELNVACAFHSPLVAGAREAFAGTLREIEIRQLSIDVYSNSTGTVYPWEPSVVQTQLTEHIVRPVHFVHEIEAMYEAGARIFVEVGPNSILTGLVGKILGDRPHAAIATDVEGRSALTQLQLALARLIAAGIGIDTSRLFVHRTVRRLDLAALGRAGASETKLSPTTWMVDGGKAVPLRDVGKKREWPEISVSVPGREKQPAQQSVQGQAPQRRSSAPVPARQKPGSAGVMEQFQQLMTRFLETQESVMLAYLDKGAAPSLPAGGIPVGLQGSVASTPPRVDTSVTDVREINAAEVAAPAITRETLTSHLLTIVAERTGYPPEMLGLDVDLEADLGIDSIKRIEILVSFQELFGEGAPADPDAFEELTQIRTLGGIVDWILKRIEAGAATPTGQEPATLEAGVETNGSAPHSTLPEPPDPGDTRGPDLGRPVVAGSGSSAPDSRAATPRPETTIYRSLIQIVDARPSASDASLMRDGVVLITDDGRGIAAALEKLLGQEGVPAVRVEVGEVVQKTGAGTYSCAFDEDSVKALSELIRANHGQVAGLVHLLPLRPVPELETARGLDAWRVRLAQDVEGLFLLSKHLSPDLRSAAVNGGASVLAVSGMGGAFGTDEAGPWFAGNGAVAGFAKSLAREWPQVRVRAVDLDAGADATQLAAHLRRELHAGSTDIEVGYLGDRRIALDLVPGLAGSTPALHAERSEELILESSDVILITGGARGITSVVARGLARRYRPTLLLTGTAPEPTEQEDPSTADLVSPKELKAAIIEAMRSAGGTPAPARVESEYVRLMKEREIRSTLADLRAEGASVWYAQVDMRDESAVRSFLDGIYERFGRLDGVVHGAGVIADKLVETKDAASFHRVLSTKADSGFLLARHLRFDRLKFLLFFSSIAGRAGNRGQTDYAAGNEILNKLAVQLDRTHPTRVAAIEWGPWEGGGMVSPELERLMHARGVGLIPARDGERMFDEELRLGRKGEAEVVIGGWVEADAPAPASNGHAHATTADMVQVR